MSWAMISILDRLYRRFPPEPLRSRDEHCPTCHESWKFEWHGEAFTLVCTDPFHMDADLDDNDDTRVR